MLLESINSPQDLHRLKTGQLSKLAAEIRTCIVDTLAKTGGHLGANLGVVELTLALHSVLDSPTDKLIWDVGHQCYAHKLVTGRRRQFHTLRQMHGIAGFPKNSESPHDAFDVGHSSTSISAAAGMAIARDRLGQRHKVVAVIGDGALTGGMAFEALNHLGQLQTDLVVVLNDNAMSIARNVGALSDYLNRLRMDPTFSKARDELDRFVRRIPAIGGSMSKMATSLKDALKSLLPGQLFEELGFSYFGPFDGHDIRQMRRALREGFARGGPVLVHVLTQKGRGYGPAEQDPSKYHGISPEDHQQQDSESTYSQVFGKTLCRLAQANPKLVAITAAMAGGTGLAEFARTYPDRFFDVGIAEQHALTMAAGMAASGLRPVVALYSTFLQRGYDQLIHDISMTRQPVVIAIDRAGVVGDDGPTHHGVFDLSFLRSIPHLEVLAPADGAELAAMLDWALSRKGPVAIRYPRGWAVETHPMADTDYHCCQVLRRGADCTVFAVGSRVAAAVEAATLLEPDVSCTVVNVRRVKPLDCHTITNLAAETGVVVTVEDNVVTGGFGSAVLETLASSQTLVSTMGFPDEFLPQGSQDELYQAYGLDAAGIAQRIRSLSQVFAL